MPLPLFVKGSQKREIECSQVQKEETNSYSSGVHSLDKALAIGRFYSYLAFDRNRLTVVEQKIENLEQDVKEIKQDLEGLKQDFKEFKLEVKDEFKEMKGMLDQLLQQKK